MYCLRPRHQSQYIWWLIQDSFEFRRVIRFAISLKQEHVHKYDSNTYMWISGIAFKYSCRLYIRVLCWNEVERGGQAILVAKHGNAPKSNISMYAKVDHSPQVNFANNVKHFESYASISWYICTRG